MGLIPPLAGFGPPTGLISLGTDRVGPPPIGTVSLDGLGVGVGPPPIGTVSAAGDGGVNGIGLGPAGAADIIEGRPADLYIIEGRPADLLSPDTGVGPAGGVSG